MNYFLANHRSNVVRLVSGVLLLLAITSLSITVLPNFAPDHFQVVFPILIFGWISLYLSTTIAVTDHSKESDRYGALGAMVFAAFVVGGAIGSDAVGGAYGWFLAIVCGSLALIGAVIGLFLIPRSNVLEDVKITWSVAMRRY